ncbi:MAG TPA: PhoD-like phosphatase N-terminal domain-containing protein, partial [Candidatus Syntrophosphaera sp.]|nr:PhoD-like phosphatase N-terminal domain-containing protein [Candidatus Syntrophosphaera sp.]
MNNYFMETHHHEWILTNRLGSYALGTGNLINQRKYHGLLIASDERMYEVVQRGEALAHRALAHSVHVEARGLPSGRPYWYRFRVPGGDASPVGRAWTAPQAGAPLDRHRM